MRGYATAVLMGNLTGDIEVINSNNGSQFGVFSIAVNKKYNGNEKVSFFKCIANSKIVENIGQYLVKGKQVLVEAEPQQKKWQDNNGNNRYDIEFSVRQVQLLGGNDRANEGSSPSHSFEDDIPI